MNDDLPYQPATRPPYYRPYPPPRVQQDAWGALRLVLPARGEVYFPPGSFELSMVLGPKGYLSIHHVDTNVLPISEVRVYFADGTIEVC